VGERREEEEWREEGEGEDWRVEREGELGEEREGKGDFERLLERRADGTGREDAATWTVGRIGQLLFLPPDA